MSSRIWAAKGLVLGVVALWAAGCGPQVDSRKVVSVDWQKLAGVSVAEERFDVPAGNYSVPDQSVVLPAVVMRGHPDAGLDRAWDKANESQVALLHEEVKLQSKEPLEAFRLSRLAEIDRELGQRRIEQASEVKSELAAFQSALKLHGDELGWDRVKLAWKAGFPDPDPKSQHPPTTRQRFAFRNWPDAVSLRSTISEKDAIFDQLWKQRLNLGQVARDAELDRLNRNLNEDLVLDMSREAERLRSQAKDSDVQLTRKPVVHLDSVKSESAIQQSIPAVGVAMPPIPTSHPDDSTWTTKVRLPIFLAQNNYRLANPGEKGQDVTEDFRVWLRQYEVGS
ncbi:MAG: hypothetical protein ABUL72_00380 [Armatimonadota bacterium]